ncbi:MAG: energy coupling factor transporter S component ThiW [Candidatus Hermodarchaeota archaeon]
MSNKGSKLTLKITTTAIFIAVGVVLSALNPFGYFLIFGTKINPFAHLINAMTGVLIGFLFSTITALGIAIIRFSFSLGTIHAFHGGISGAVVVGLIAYILKKKDPKYTIYAALFEPIGTVFIGGSIGYLVAPIGSTVISGLLTYWWLFFLSSIVGTILGFLMLLILKRAGYTWENFS